MAIWSTPLPLYVCRSDTATMTRVQYCQYSLWKFGINFSWGSELSYLCKLLCHLGPFYEWNYCTCTCTVFVGVVEYMDVWKKFDGAGTHLVDSLCNSLCGSDYQHLGLETSQAFNVIYASSNGIDPSGKLREIEKLLIGLRSHLESVENVEKTNSHLQVNFNFTFTHVLQLCKKYYYLLFLFILFIMLIDLKSGTL